MATGVGLRIGNVESVAAVVSDSAPTTPEYLVRTTEFPRVDPTNTTPDPTLIATSMLALLDDVTSRIAPPDSIVATYPSDWSVDTVAAVRTSLLSLGLDEVALVADDVATATDHAAALRGARLAAASLSSATTTLVVPRMASAQRPLAYSAMSDAPAFPAAWATPVYRPAAVAAPPTKQFAPIPVSVQRRNSANPVIAGVFLLAFVITIMAAIFYLNPDLGNFRSAFGETNESTSDSSNFTPFPTTVEETTPPAITTTETTPPPSETSTTSEIPPTSATTSTSEPTLSNSAGSGLLGLG